MKLIIKAKINPLPGGWLILQLRHILLFKVRKKNTE